VRVEGSDGSDLEQSPGIVNEVGWVSLLGMTGTEHSYMDWIKWIKDLEPQHIGPLSDINSLDEVSSYSILYFPG
jgi:hypothetical protein